MPFRPYYGERSGSYVLCDKLIDVKEDKIKEIKENSLTLLRESDKRSAILRWIFLFLCAFLPITLSYVHKQFFDVQKKKKNV